MNGKNSKMAIGMKPIKIGEDEYDTKLQMNDTADYIKYIQSQGLKLQFYAQEKEIEKVVKITDEIVDYRRDLVIKALKLAGMEDAKADMVVAQNIQDIVGDGKIDIWLGFATKEDLEEQKKLKN